MEISLEQKLIGGLFGLCIGDALGAPVEFMFKKLIHIRYGKVVNYKSGIYGIPFFLRNSGDGTDDSALMLCLLRSILKNPESPCKIFAEELSKTRWTTIIMAGKNLILDFILFRGNWYETSQKVDKILKGKTAGNGALMRSLPVALFYNDLDKIIKITSEQAKMTHWSEISTKACIIYNTIAYYLLKNMSLKDSIEKATKNTEYENYSEIPNMPPNGFSVATLKWALYWLSITDSFENAIISTINYGGDTDTIGAIVGGLAGIHYGINSIPKQWKNELNAKLSKEISDNYLILCNKLDIAPYDIK